MMYLTNDQDKYMWKAYDVIVKRRRQIKGIFDIESESCIHSILDGKFHENEIVNSNYKLKIIKSILIPITTMFFLSNNIKKIKSKDVILTKLNNL